MMCCITGVPGTGKSSVSSLLEERGYPVIRLVDVIGEYTLSVDTERMTTIVDEERLSREFSPVDGYVEGLLTHFLPCDRVVVLRCRPDVLRKRLVDRGYTPVKVDENV